MDTVSKADSPSVGKEWLYYPSLTVDPSQGLCVPSQTSLRSTLTHLTTLFASAHRWRRAGSEHSREACGITNGFHQMAPTKKKYWSAGLSPLSRQGLEPEAFTQSKSYMLMSLSCSLCSNRPVDDRMSGCYMQHDSWGMLRKFLFWFHILCGRPNWTFGRVCQPRPLKCSGWHSYTGLIIWVGPEQEI